MGRPSGNGLIELIDEKSHDRGFFCMQLVAFIMKEKEKCGRSVADLWEERFGEAKNGVCRYSSSCHIYAKSMINKPRQLKFEFK